MVARVGPLAPAQSHRRDTADSVGELGGVGPTRLRGRDKSGPYALAIASLGLFWQFANRVTAEGTAGDHKGPPHSSQPPSPLRITQPPSALPGIGGCLLGTVEAGETWLIYGTL